MEDERSGGFLTDDERHELISGVLSNIDISKARRALEHAAKSKLVTDFVQFLTNFSLERWLRGTILKTAEDSLQRGKMSDEDAKHLLEQRDEFLSCFDSIMGTSDNPEQRRIDTLVAIQSAFAIALYSDGSESVKLALAEHARSEKEIVDNIRRQILNAAIIAEAKHMNRALACSIEFARELHPGVRRYLGLESDGAAEVRKQLSLRPDDTTWPSQSTIKATIAKMLKPARANRVGRTSARANRAGR